MTYFSDHIYQTCVLLKCCVGDRGLKFCTGKFEAQGVLTLTGCFRVEEGKATCIISCHSYSQLESSDWLLTNLIIFEKMTNWNSSH